MTTPYNDLDLYHEFRIATYMHAVYARVGRDRDALRKAAEDCARWYDVDLQTVIRVWHKAFPEDLDITQQIEDTEEDTCQQ